MPFSIFKVHNGWIVIKGDHSYLSSKDLPEAWVFTSTQALAQYLDAASKEKK